ncbi:hypothetical protein THAOC_11255 [Thalassiosira oceanica]|uniref:Uncharacterized protein n=1 Tax=Thalassiosira oceanica TaxID=159749 RepID=K0T322_THAOC|nr:hypothetical protein THAOC_11255 [Thalassiosira oceanica]|eukprot:EJK67681.1 hypothetical protein THAOC_11255 [Thalassiosira oceanica]
MTATPNASASANSNEYADEGAFQLANEQPLDRDNHAQGWGSAHSKAMKSGKDAKAEKYTTPEYQGKATKVFGAAKGAKTVKPTEMLDGDAAAATRGVSCAKKALAAEYLLDRYDVNMTIPGHARALAMAANGNLGIGSTTQLIPEANDASRVDDALVVDGISGDTRFPHGDLKALFTTGELNMCDNEVRGSYRSNVIKSDELVSHLTHLLPFLCSDESSQFHGDSYTGVPDGMGAYLVDDSTLRVVVQSESYGPVTRYETWPYPTNKDSGLATFTGSHVQYTDFDRLGLSNFMHHDGPASDIVKGFGQVATTYYNLAGDRVGPRNGEDATPSGAHYSNTDADGNWALVKFPKKADWNMQSLCSSHLEEKHQWGPGIGLEDDMYITNEEWITYAPGSSFVGISMHAMDLANAVDYAVGSVTVSGWEKIVELNPAHTDYVVLSLSGYNGAYNNPEGEIDGRNAEYSKPDGTDYVDPKNVCPARIYIGMKGKMEDGSDAPADDFLARNGLRYGKVYGFAIDMSESGPTGGLFRDAFHKPRHNGAKVEGKFVPIDWQWDGTVKNFRHDGAWEFQLPVPGFDDLTWWNSGSLTEPGSKTEHNSPDTREGMTAFIQGSTAGYFGHYYVNGVTEALKRAKKSRDDFPASLDSDYYVYQGENDITGQIDLGGAGLYAQDSGKCPSPVDGEQINDATYNCDRDFSVKSTFEDIDGLEVVAASEGLFVVIQEDSGNDLGERMFISSVLEHEDDGEELMYYFMAMSGGKYNTRMMAGVGIPATASSSAGGHEFSGVIDLSGMLKKEKKDSSKFSISAGDGHAKREAELEVPIEDKLIVLGLQAHNYHSGVVEAFEADRGGQVLLYKPDFTAE